VSSFFVGVPGFAVRSGTETTTSTLIAARKKAVPDENDEKFKNDKMDPSKRAALDGVLNQIERSYGRGSNVKIGRCRK
jgi:hypothetical protein